MKLRSIAFPVVILMSLLVTLAYGEKTASSDAKESVQAFLGRWDLTLKASDREYPSWIEIRQEDGQLKAQMVSRWGNARPLPRFEISSGKITFVSPKEEEDRKDDMVFEGKMTGDTLSGTTTGQDGTPWTWTGKKAPSLRRTGTPKWGKPVKLFNGKDFTGWRPDKPNAEKSWTVENGTLVTPGNGPELINDSKFEDFKLHIEFKCQPESNSGVYLRGRYEVQIETDSVQEPASHHTGGVYGFLAPSPEQPRKSGEWQSFDITLVGRKITVVQNGTTVIDDQEIPGITGGALDSHEELPGPIYLQGGEKGHVAFRNIILTPARK
ncbi:MAG: DUF1080 domain-containing protein [Acidobacteriota bacterium]|nr:DUF1080 domain-containing protein [Acidobacteriota bacterium]